MRLTQIIPQENIFLIITTVILYISLLRIRNPLDGGISMKKFFILLLPIMILSGCTQNTEEKTIIDDLTNAGYILDDINMTDLNFDVTLISVRSINDTLSDNHNIIYEVSSDDVELFYQNQIDYS